MGTCSVQDPALSMLLVQPYHFGTGSTHPPYIAAHSPSLRFSLLLFGHIPFEVVLSPPSFLFSFIPFAWLVQQISLVPCLNLHYVNNSIIYILATLLTEVIAAQLLRCSFILLPFSRLLARLVAIFNDVRCSLCQTQVVVEHFRCSECFSALAVA